MKTINTEELRKMRANRQDFLLINVLSKDHFEEAHIPGSINIPYEKENFLEEVEKRAEGMDQTIVLYCASTDCDLSPRAAMKIEEAGFQDVLDYEAGMKAWKEAGLEVSEGVRG